MRDGRWAAAPLSLLTLAAVFVASPALAQEDTGLALSDKQLKGLHVNIDEDGDGKVSLSEVTSYATKVTLQIAAKDVRAMIEEVDKDKDGQLSLEEHLDDMRSATAGGHEELEPDNEDDEDPDGYFDQSQEPLELGEDQAYVGTAQEKTDFQHRKEEDTAKFTAADEDGDGKLSLEEMPFFFYPETHERVLGVAVEQLMLHKDRNQDGKLSPMEFWDTEESSADEHAISDEEYADFQHLDEDGDGFLCLQDLRQWESGRFHLEAAMTKLFESADKDHDMHLSLDELLGAREFISVSDAQYHFVEWAEHAEL